MLTYNDLLLSVQKNLKLIGWRKTGATFYIKKDGNWGLLNFQKSRSSSAAKTLFTINLGVSSEVISKFKEDDLSAMPNVWSCHWRERIGVLLPQKNDYWWHFDDGMVSDKMHSEIIDVVHRVAVPEVMKHLTDADLAAVWFDAFTKGIANLPNYTCLSILLKAADDTRIYQVINEIKTLSKGKYFEPVSKQHIIQLGFSYD